MKLLKFNKKKIVESAGIDPAASRMQSERSTIWATTPEGAPWIEQGTNRTAADRSTTELYPPNKLRSLFDHYSNLILVTVRFSAVWIEHTTNGTTVHRSTNWAIPRYNL